MEGLTQEVKDTAIAVALRTFAAPCPPFMRLFKRRALDPLILAKLQRSRSPLRCTTPFTPSISFANPMARIPSGMTNVVLPPSGDMVL